MKRFLCVFLALIIALGCSPVFAAGTPTDIVLRTPPASDTDIVTPTTDTETGSITGDTAVSEPAADSAEGDAGYDYSDWDALIQAFFEKNNISPETVSLAYYNTVTGEEHYFRGEEMMTAASVKKLPLNMYYAEKVTNGEISFDETRYGGLPYSEVQELSLRYSNNEYTDILINAIGTYPDYRRAMCPYIGVDPDEMEFGFFTANELSAQQAMYCLKLLYSDPERYPGVMDNMLLATPGEYFEQIVTDYEIAQKYGWYVMDGHNCINCVGIVETEEPILLAIFTDNCSMGRNILGEYCALMCNYTENDIALRREAEAERLAAEEDAQRLAEEEAARLAAEAEAERLKAEEEAQRLAAEQSKEEAPVKEEEMDIAENAIRVVACIIACAVLAVALGLVSRRKNKAASSEEKTSLTRNIVSAVLGLVSVAAIVVTINVCMHGLDARPVIMDESSDPSERAEEFLSLVLSGESAEAEAMLLGSGKLGLESEPEDALGQMLYAALRDSFSYEKLGGGFEDSIDATERFSVTYLDIPSITALQQEATNARLAEYLEAAERAEEVQAEDGSWLPEVAMRALEEVTAELLLNAEAHYVTAELEISLQYSGGEWRIIADEELFAILSGNTAY